MDKSEQDKILLPVPLDKIEARDKKIRVEFWPKFKKFAAPAPLS